MAITTVGDIITSALSKVLVNNAQDTLSSADTQLAFDALGVLIDALGIERLACYALTTTAHPLTGGTGSYTIGTGGVFNVDRPARIETPLCDWRPDRTTSISRSRSSRNRSGTRSR